MMISDSKSGVRRPNPTEWTDEVFEEVLSLFEEAFPGARFEKLEPVGVDADDGVIRSNAPIILAKFHEWWAAGEIQADDFVRLGVEALMQHGWTYVEAMDHMVVEVGG